MKEFITLKYVAGNYVLAFSNDDFDESLRFFEEIIINDIDFFKTLKIIGVSGIILNDLQKNKIQMLFEKYKNNNIESLETVNINDLRKQLNKENVKTKKIENQLFNFAFQKTEIENKDEIKEKVENKIIESKNHFQLRNDLEEKKEILMDENYSKIKNLNVKKILPEKKSILQKNLKLSKSKSVKKTNCLFLKERIRSGRRIDYSGDVVILGDVNPGAEIFATGNIIVMGTLKGRVFAGINGDEKCFVCANVMLPQIIRISNLYYLDEDLHIDEKIVPKIAVIENSKIVIKIYS